jgi:hypothetical protein
VLFFALKLGFVMQEMFLTMLTFRDEKQDDDDFSSGDEREQKERSKRSDSISPGVSSSKKKPRHDGASSLRGIAGGVCFTGGGDWTPIYSGSAYPDGNFHMCCSVAINAPSGVDVTSMDGVKVKVSSCSKLLEVTVMHPLRISCPKHLHEPWHMKDPLSLPDTDPRMLGFHSFYSQHRASQNDRIFSTCKIKLPFAVDKNIVSIKRYGEPDGSKIVYVELRALEKNDYAGPMTSDYISLGGKTNK